MKYVLIKKSIIWIRPYDNHLIISVRMWHTQKYGYRFRYEDKVYNVRDIEHSPLFL